MLICRARHMDTNEVHEGTYQEVADLVHRDHNTIRNAAYEGRVVDNKWIITEMGEAEDFPDHAKRLGLEKKCASCGKTFVAKKFNTVCCSHNCTKAHDLELQRERYHKEKRGKLPKKHKELTLEEFANEASKAGTSYGKLEAQKWLEKNRIIRRGSK